MDHFKRFNEAEGFPAGDAILGHVEATARTFSRVRDTFARIGGEEFGVVLPAMDLQAGLLRGDTTSGSCAHADH